MTRCQARLFVWHTIEGLCTKIIGLSNSASPSFSLLRSFCLFLLNPLVTESMKKFGALLIIYCKKIASFFKNRIAAGGNKRIGNKF